MDMTTRSTKLGRLCYQRQNAGLNTKATFINAMREKGLGADYLAAVTWNKDGLAESGH